MDASITARPGASLDFWFEFGSNYSYITVMRIREEATRYGVAVHWKPFLLGPIFESFGWETSPFVLQKEKGRYTWKDMERQCHKYGLPWTMPTTFPRSAILPLRVALAGAAEDWMPDYCREVMQLNFALDRDIDSRDAVEGVLKALGLPVEEIMDAALSEPNKLKLRAQTESAKAMGIFGAPTFMVGDEMFWGNDRLEDALAHAAEQARLSR